MFEWFPFFLGHFSVFVVFEKFCQCFVILPYTAGRVRPNPGRIVDYDPAEQQFGGGGGGTPYSNRNSAGARQVYDSNIGRGENTHNSIHGKNMAVFILKHLLCFVVKMSDTKFIHSKMVGIRMSMYMYEYIHS